MLQKSLILAVETSSRAGSVAIARGSNLLDQRAFSAPLRHSAEIFPAITTLLDRLGLGPDDIDQIYISIGPGSFTGLRIAVTIAKTMALANSVRIVTVDSLDAIAANVTDVAPGASIGENRFVPSGGERLATVLDAKRGQFFAAVYERTSDAEPTGPCPEGQDPGYRIAASQQETWRKIRADGLITAQELLAQFAADGQRLLLAGDGLLHHQDRFRAENTRVLDQACWSPHAVQVHALGYQKACHGRFIDPLELAPFYLRGPHVTLRRTASP